MPGPENSKSFKQLRRDPTALLQFAKAVFFFKNAKLVQFHSAKQTAINRAHNLGGDHRFGNLQAEGRRLHEQKTGGRTTKVRSKRPKKG
jgi:hypothetical protein